MEELASKGGDIKQLLTILHNNAQKYNSLMLNKPNLMHINKTPLMRAIQNGNFDQARLLVAYGALFCPRSERDRIKIPQDMLGYKATDYIESALMGHGEKAEQFRQELADIQELHLLETSFFVPADFVAPFEKYSLDLVESVLENKERPDPKRYIDAWEREQAQTAEAPSLEVASASTPRSRSRSGSEDLTTESGSPEPVSPPQQYIG
jgi:ankyrin repeat protein